MKLKLIFLAFIFTITHSALAKPRLEPNGDGSNKSGADPQANVGSTTTNPMTTQAPNSQATQPILHDYNTGRGIAGEKPSKGVVGKTTGKTADKPNQKEPERTDEFR